MMVQFKFDLQQQVKIKDVDLTGTISGMRYFGAYNEYLVQYWTNGDFRESWLMEKDIA